MASINSSRKSDPAMRRITVRLRDDQYEWLKQESRRTGRSMSAIVRDAIDSYFGLPPWDASLKTRTRRA